MKIIWKIFEKYLQNESKRLENWKNTRFLQFLHLFGKMLANILQIFCKFKMQNEPDIQKICKRNMQNCRGKNAKTMNFQHSSLYQTNSHNSKQHVWLYPCLWLATKFTQEYPDRGRIDTLPLQLSRAETIPSKFEFLKGTCRSWFKLRSTWL